MSQISRSGAIVTSVQKLIPDIGPDVTPDITGAITVIGGLNITTDGTTPNTLEINVSGTTDHAVQIGNATNSLSSLTLNDGETLLGSTGNDPIPTELLGTAGRITLTPGVGTLTWDTGSDVATAFLADDTNVAVPTLGIVELAGGNNIVTSAAGDTVTFSVNGTTQFAVQVGGAAGDLASIPVGTDGQVLLGDTGNNPAFATLTSAQSTIDFTTGAASLALDVNDSLQITTGFESWSAVGPYFDDTTLGDFTLLVAGTGYINTEPIAWTAPQTVSGMTAGNTYFIYIDNTGTIQKTNTFTDALFRDNIVLFECLRDSTLVNNQITVKENHPFEMPVETSLYAHKVIGTVIENVNNGANITLNGTQKIQINGDDVFSDHGLYTDIPDSAGVGVTFRQMYTNAGGKWATDTLSDTFTGRYNNAGTPTALTANRYAVYRLYVSKDSLNTTTPSYFAVLHTAQFVTTIAANSAIGNGTIAAASNELSYLEIAQLGYIIYSEASASIVSVIIEKATLRQTLSTAGTSTASLVNTVTTNFDGILSAADTNVQAALETIDEFGKNLTDHCVVVGNGNGNPLGVIGAGTTGQLLVGATGADPAFGASAAADFSFTNAVAATPRSFSVENNDTDPGSYACVAVSTEPLGGDPYIFWEIDSATQYYSMGIDNSDSDKWKFTNNVNPSTGDAIITSTNAGVITLFNDLDVSEGGTGVSTLTSHGVLLGNGAGDIQATAEGATGSGLMGNTGANPSWTGSPSFSGTVTAGTGLTATTGNVTVTAGNVTLPTTTATTGQIQINGKRFIHDYASDYNVFVGTEAGNTTLTVGNAILETGVGYQALNALTTGDSNTAVGYQSGVLITSGQFNTGVGLGSNQKVATTGGNTGCGYNANGSTGQRNTAVGMQSYAQVTATGSYNTSLGYQAAVNYTGAESSNICIMNTGTLGESNKIRIGTQGAGNGQQNAAYIAGIYGVTPGGTLNMCIVDSNGQLGSAALPTGVPWTAVAVDAGLAVNTGTVANKAGLLTMTLPATAVVGDIIEITGINTAVGWRIAQNANQVIHFGNVSTTPGVGGYLEATAIRDSVKLLCVVAGASTEYNVLSSVGNITIV